MNRSIILFTSNRYLVYAGQFTRGILLAKLLGPEFFGIWGFLNLIQQYMTYSNFGVQYALNVELSTTAKDNPEKGQRIFASSLTVTAATFILLTSFGIWCSVYGQSFFSEYLFSTYSILVALYAALLLVQELLGNVYRHHTYLKPVAIAELITTFIPFAAFFIYDSSGLLSGFFTLLIVSTIIALFQLMWKLPLRMQLSTDGTEIKNIVRTGFPLLLFNSGFYMLLVVGRTIVGLFYEPVIMGYYSFAYSITNAVMLGINAISWVILPNVLSKMRQGISSEEIVDAMRRIGSQYSVAVLGCVLTSILCIPLLFVYLEKYTEAWDIIIIQLVTQAVIAFSFTATSLAMARKKNVALAGITFVGVLMSAVCCGIAYAYGADFVWIAAGALIGAVVFTIHALWFSSVILQMKTSFKDLIRFLLPKSTVAILLLPLFGVITQRRILFSSIALGIYLLLYRKMITGMVRSAFATTSPDHNK